MILLVIALLFLGQVLGNAIPVERSELGSNPLNRVKRVVGGGFTDIHLHPWMASIQVNEAHYCGGTIINSRVVLTSAHCLSTPRFNIHKLSIRVGSSSNEYGGSVHKVDELVYHPGFNDHSFDRWIRTSSDLGLMKVSPPFRFTENVRPVQMAGRGYAEGTKATIAGWGRRKEMGHTPAELRSADLYISNKTKCIEDYSYNSDLDWSGMLCAAAPATDRCKYDDGGPLTVDGVQVGIISWGEGCARPEYRGVYTNISMYRDWIDEKSRYLESPESDKFDRCLMVKKKGKS